MAAERPKVKRGEVYMADPDPVVGHEQGGPRPFLVISVNQMNRSRARLAVGVPLTTTNRGNELHIRLEPPEGGLARISYAMPEMVRSMSIYRLERKLGHAPSATVDAVSNRVGILVGLGRSR